MGEGAGVSAGDSGPGLVLALPPPPLASVRCVQHDYPTTTTLPQVGVYSMTTKLTGPVVPYPPQPRYKCPACKCDAPQVTCMYV